MRALVENAIVTFAALSAALFLVALAVLLFGHCGPKAPTLTPADGVELNDHAKKLIKCEREAREADSFAVFDVCARREGLK